MQHDEHHKITQLPMYQRFIQYGMQGEQTKMAELKLLHWRKDNSHGPNSMNILNTSRSPVLMSSSVPLKNTNLSAASGTTTSIDFIQLDFANAELA
jgi:hypothetical protein